MLTPRRWNKFLFGAIALGVGAGGVIAFALTSAFKGRDVIYNIPGDTEATLSVIKPAE